MKKTTSTILATLALAFTSAGAIAFAADTPPPGQGPGHQDAGAPYGPPGHAGDPGKQPAVESTLATEPETAPQKDEKVDPDWEHGNPPHATPVPGGPGGGPGWAKEKGQ